MKKFIIAACVILASACGISEATPPEGAPTKEEPEPITRQKIHPLRAFGLQAGIVRTPMIVTVTLDPNDPDSVSKTSIMQYFVWDNWGSKTAKYQIVLAENRATKTLLRIEQSMKDTGEGQDLSVVEPSGVVDLAQDTFEPTVPRLYDSLTFFDIRTWGSKPYFTDLLVKAGFERTGEVHTVKDRECELVQVASARRYCMWQGIALSDESYNAVTQTVGFTDGIYLGTVDARHFELGELEWPTEVIADLQSYAYE